jgi:cation diffusion facilitator family transporter
MLAAQRSAAAARSTWVSVVVNILLATTQVGVGLASKSQGLIADGIHSLSDLVSDFIVLLAGHHSKKEADEEHPYGHQRFETAASLALGVLLLGVGVGMLWAAFRKLEYPETVPRVHIAALWVAAVALVSKELLFRYMLAVAKRVKSGMLVANAWHARSDAASSLVVGIGILGNLAGYPILDPIATLIVGFLVGKMGWTFGWQALHDLMDRSADALEVEALRALPTLPDKTCSGKWVELFGSAFLFHSPFTPSGQPHGKDDRSDESSDQSKRCHPAQHPEHHQQERHASRVADQERTQYIVCGMNEQ